LPRSSTADKRIILVDGEFAGAVNSRAGGGRFAFQHGPRRRASHDLTRASARIAQLWARRCASADVVVGIDVIDGISPRSRDLADRHPPRSSGSAARCRCHDLDAIEKSGRKIISSLRARPGRTVGLPRTTSIHSLTM